MHARFLQVDGGKMSKSIGNLYTVEQLEGLGHPPVAVRFALIRGHYRQVLNFTLDGLRQAASDVRRLRLFAAEMQDASARGSPDAAPPSWVREATSRFDAGMNDDLNVSAALDGVFSLLNDANRVKARGDDAAAALVALRRMDRVLGLLETAPQSVGRRDRGAHRRAQRRARGARLPHG
jgi:cysteinyl-tRNA synthetase